MDDVTWIRDGLEKPGKTQAGLAKALAIDPAGVSKLLAGKRLIKANELPKIRAYLEAPAEDESKLLSERASADNTREAVVARTQGAVASMEGQSHLSWPKDLKIIGHVKAGVEGFFLDQGEHHGLAYRPPVLANVKDAFAVYVQDDSMVPAFEPGQIAWIHPHKPAAPGCNIIIEMDDGQAFIKRLVRRTATKVICLQWQPKREIEYDIKKVKQLYYVVGSYRED